MPTLLKNVAYQTSAATINIGTYGFDDKRVAMFKYAFQKFEKFKIEVLSHTDTQQADILFFDIDDESAHSIWQKLNQSGQSTHSNLSIPESSSKDKPVISLSYTPIEQDYGINILKPLSMDKLFSAIENCIERFSFAVETNAESLAKSKSEAIPLITIEEVSADQEVLAIEKSKPLIESTKQKISEQKLAKPIQKPSKNSKKASTQTSTQASTQALTKIMFFDQDKGLLGVLSQIYNEKKTALIYLEHDKRGLFYAIPQNNSIYIKASGAEIKNICREQQKVSFSELETHSFDADKIARPYHKYQLDIFLWLIALMTGKGRIPIAINPTKNQLGLKLWPNLTRYKSNPEFLRFAAFLSQTPTNYLLAQKLLNPSKGNLANFITACYALGILTIDQTMENQSSEVNRMNKPHKYRNVIGQIFSRLFNK